MLAGLSNWIFGIIVAGLFLAGLFVAAGGTHDAYAFGLGLSALSLVCMIVLVRNILRGSHVHH